ncbi:hypothetical protein CRUP_005851 [Coryphaenoides rupestris]|nr:hypothetical protein CRUP_005851 [Coryphaenoides rupestris]
MACWGISATIVAACLLGMAVSQTTTPAPAVVSTTSSGEIVTGVTTTPLTLGSTTPPGCSLLNTSTCQICVPGSNYDNETQMCSCCPVPGFCLFPGACLLCARGFYQPLAGQQQCLPCGQGFYSNPDVSPILCPSDAFCQAGSTSPGYCMETFFRKSGETCELAPVTIAMLVIGLGVALLFVILIILRRRRDTDKELSAARTPLLCKEHPQGRYYGIPCDAEPVYAGW